MATEKADEKQRFRWEKSGKEESVVAVPSMFRVHPFAQNYVHHTAREALKNGISVVPIRADGTKQPALASWREYQRRQASREEVDHWFRSGVLGIAFITGSVSGNLEALDFDDGRIFEAWLSRMQQDQAMAALYTHLSRGYLESTPAGGRHLLYRCDKAEGNKKLAARSDGDKRETLIETRGEGGLIIVAPSHGLVHPSGKSYILLRGSVSSIRTITAHQRERLFSVAREFNTLPSSDLHAVSPKQLLCLSEDGQRPGDLFNRLASWEEVLIPHGWELERVIDGEGYWRRPGKIGPGISATTNYAGSDLLYVFSTSTAFDSERGYNKFQAYTLLNHGGDFSAAARALVEQGYVAREVTT
jgi:hypothetical protein